MFVSVLMKREGLISSMLTPSLPIYWFGNLATNRARLRLTGRLFDPSNFPDIPDQ